MRRPIMLAGVAVVGCVLAACSATLGGSAARTEPAARSVPATPTKPAAPHRVTTTPPAANPCAGNTRAHLVRVSVAQQHQWMCAGSRLAYQTAVTTGIPTEEYHTPTGTYAIQAKLTDQALTLLTGDRYVVDYWIPFDAPLFGFHDSAWQTFPYGSSRYRTAGSHGCVHMPLAAIAWLYEWAPVGTPVVIS
jgi:lipoprotein-anchoring transpeptidase ErfK/SrfK